MSNQLPVSRVVQTTVTLTPAGAQAQSISDLLVLGTSAVIDPVERLRTYSDLASVAADFGTMAEEYLAAVEWFDQSPQPQQILIGRWVKTASKGGLRCAPLSTAQQATVLTEAAGKFGIAVDGAGVVQIGPLDFTGQTNLNGVAALIDAAVAGASCVWNSTYSRFEFTSDSTGATSAVSFLTTPLAGTDIAGVLGGKYTSSGAYTFAGLDPETAVTAVGIFDNLFGQKWYGLFVPAETTDNGTIAVAGFIQGAGNKHIFGVGSTEAGFLVANNTTNIGYLLKQLAYNRTLVQYSSTSIYAVVSAMARILTTDYNQPASVITLKFKQEPGIPPENLSTTQANAVESFNANVFVQFNNNTAILEQGVMSDGTFVDIVTGTDWLALDIQTSVYNLLYTTPTKIPQTNSGVQLIITTIEAVCAQGVINGLLAPGVWNSDGFGIITNGTYLQKGYYVYAMPIDQQNPADRAARKAPPIKVAAKLAGAIHSADIAILVNQ